MEKAPSKKGASKVRHLGRKKNKILAYYAKVYPSRKIRHLLKNNSFNDAKSWAAKHSELGLLGKIARELGIEK